ncbi:MAG: DUF1826 domain-containing protein [Phycisphaeraceae bacterium]|nr:DUF1826 domain-containing protein [Phycisphaeraceae bacterium]
MSSILLQDRILQLESWDAQQLEKINNPGIDLVLINRSDFPTPSEQDVANARVDSIRCVVDQHSAEVQITDALADLGLPHCDALAGDMRDLAARFLKQFGVRRANLRVEVVDRQSCPKFHCDARKVRLITTYAGPTTEYRQADDDAEDHVVVLGAIALLKGTTHPTHNGEYILHRSPAMTEQRRLCLVLDF